MDPTDENTKDIFPAYLQNMSYLVARPEGETLKTSPIIPAARNRVLIKTQAQLDAQGQLSAHTSIDFQGINDTIYRAHFSQLKPEERRQFFEGHLRRASASATLDSITFHPAELRDTTHPLRVELHYKAYDLLTRNSDPRILKLPHLGNSIGYANFLLGETGLIERRFPLYTRITAGIQETYQLEIDPTLGIPRIPHIEATQTDELHWSRTYEQRNNILSITNRFDLHTVQFSPQEYSQLKADLEQIEYESRKQILLQNAQSNTHPPIPLNLYPLKQTQCNPISVFLIIKKPSHSQTNKTGSKKPTAKLKSSPMPDKNSRPKFNFHITPPGNTLSSPMPASPCPMESSKQSVQKKPISWMPHGVPPRLAIPLKKFSLSTCPASKSEARSSMKLTEPSLENPTSSPSLFQ